MPKVEEQAMKRRTYYALASSMFGQLSRPSLFRTAIALGGDWLVIAAVTYVSFQFSQFFSLYLFAVLVIASRQHALLVLMHEGAHGHLCSHKTANLLLSNLFASWPLAMCTERYRVHHWKHHQYTNTVQDPDWGRKVENPEWQFPKAKARFWRDFLPYLWGRGVREMWFAFSVIGVGFRSSPASLLFFGALFATLACTNGWLLFAKYWLVPALTILPVLMKVRSIVEHLALERTSELNSSRNILGNPLERFFFGPHGNALHLIHHLFPQIPWHNVGKLRQVILTDSDYAKHAHENHGYLWGTRPVYFDLIRDENVTSRNSNVAA